MREEVSDKDNDMAVGLTQRMSNANTVIGLISGPGHMKIIAIGSA